MWSVESTAYPVYTNRKLDVEKTQLPLEEFFKVLIYGDEIELKNRFLRIGAEYGTNQGESIKDFHRLGKMPTKQNDVIKDVIKLSASEEKAIKLILRTPRISAAKIASDLGVKPRQAQRIIASLKAKAGLKRRGARKNGEWYFATGKESLLAGGEKK